MRNEETWEKKIFPKVMLEFSPRLQEDIFKFPIERDVPAFGSYYIYGAIGTGKTILAANMYIEARKKQYMEVINGKFLFVVADDLFDEVKRSFTKPDFREDAVDHIDEFDITDKYAEAAYLVIDDLGSSRFTDWSSAILYRIVNYRYEHLLPTVFTSNLNLDELGAALGEMRVPSRIKRMGEILKKV